MYKNATFLSILGPYKPNKSVLELWKTYFQRGPYIFQEFLILWPPLMERYAFLFSVECLCCKFYANLVNFD